MLPPPLLLALAAPVALAAEEPRPVLVPGEPVTYAIVVGSNRPGPGQEPLSFAHLDADRMAAVLQQVGGFAGDRVLRIHDPDADVLREAIEGFGPVLEAHAARGEATSLVFYYSGHARAQGLDLGDEVYALAELREGLEGLGADLTLVVLDACQSGALTETKGILAAADFSTSSLGSLSTEGFAVIASSTASELSQESRRLGGSFFTHHLSTGLLGAADVDRDGLVTLSEAYDYAYQHTLADTARTAVGAQHATLETDLRGQGELVLSRVSRGDATLRLPEDLSAELFFQLQPAGTVIAEVHKVPGEAVDLGLPWGDYLVLVEREGRFSECRFSLLDEAPVAFEMSSELGAGCRRLSPGAVARKGLSEDQAAPPERGPLSIEASVGASAPRSTDYTDTLGRFDFGPGVVDGLDAVASLNASYRWTDHLVFVLTTGKLDDERRSRDMTTVDSVGTALEVQHDFAWFSNRVGVAARGQLPLLQGWLVPYAQGGGGLAWTTSTYTTFEGGAYADIKELHVGPHLAAAGGLQLMPRLGDYQGFGLFTQLEWVTAPVLRNELGETHDVGGSSLVFGIRVGG